MQGLKTSFGFLGLSGLERRTGFMHPSSQFWASLASAYVTAKKNVGSAEVLKLHLSDVISLRCAVSFIIRIDFTVLTI